MALGESRSDLLHWLKSSFALNYTKVEQCGTGAAYCQIMDSIYGGVPMHKVKFDLHLSDYDARANMKVLQAAFNRHKITRQIDTERLIKCRLQDNLELLQWLKRHWTENKDINVEYDAVSRRSGAGPKAGSAAGSSAATSRRNTMTNQSYGSGHTTPRARSRDPSRSGARVASSSSVASSGTGTADSLFVAKRSVSGTVSGTPATTVSSVPTDVSRDLEQKSRDLLERERELEQARLEIQDCKMMMDTLETERNFYYNKLREIEILTKKIQDHADHSMTDEDAESPISPELAGVVTDIQAILFATETGFEQHDSADAESF